MDKLGLFLCTGCKIGESLDVDGFKGVGKEKGAQTFLSHPCLCSPEGVAEINKAVDDGTVNGVLIAACSHRVKREEFRFDPTKVVVERASLREQVVWSHEANHEDTQMLAEDLIRMGLARVAKNTLTVPIAETIEETVLIVGGGLAGLEAARASAGMGCSVVLVEKEGKLGGYLAKVKDLVPEHPPYDAPVANNIGELITAVENNSKIKIFTEAKIKSIGGQPGQFEVELESGDTFKAGSIIQATGARPYDATALTHLGYGASPNVVTSTDVEIMLKEGKMSRPSDGQAPSQILFVQCAGSRDENHLPYCSSECCATTLKQVAAINRDFPEVECSVIYKDMRCPGQLEHFYLGVQENGNGRFTRGEVAQVSGNGSGPLQVQLKDSLLGDDVTLEADMVVLALGMVPNSADGEAIRILTDAYGRIEKNESDKQVAAAKEVVEQHKAHEGTAILNLDYRQGPDMPVLKYSFPDSHYICFPYETRRTGIYAAGAVHAPMDAAQAAEDGWGAAMKAVQCIEANKRGEAVHPRAGDRSIADFFLQRCTQCKRCTEECPFGTLNEDAKGTPEYNQLRCRRCGICLGACPERIISFPEYAVLGLSEMIKSIEVPDEFDEKPRMLALVCENDALPAIDEAARQGLQWDAWIRIIPVRCLGSINVVCVADALSMGIDGLILMGCKHGDDYQCHYIKGSELATKRMENVQETLDRLNLESERVKIIDVARDDYARIPKIFEEFAETIEDVGPNPYKGF